MSWGEPFQNRLQLIVMFFFIVLIIVMFTLYLLIAFSLFAVLYVFLLLPFLWWNKDVYIQRHSFVVIWYAVTSIYKRYATWPNNFVLLTTQYMSLTLTFLQEISQFVDLHHYADDAKWLFVILAVAITFWNLIGWVYWLLI